MDIAPGKNGLVDGLKEKKLTDAENTFFYIDTQEWRG
jgi:hypothetical protein